MYDHLHITDNEVEEIDFFHDFIIYLSYLEKNPIERTITGNISLKGIQEMSKLFREQKVFEEYKKLGWKITTETQIQFLTQIKILAEVMYLTYKRKKKLLLSKNGKGYLHNISPSTQYWNMVLHFWNKVNWTYFTPTREINGLSVSDVLQKNQHIIWQALLRKGDSWIDFEPFCQSLNEYFHLYPYNSGEDDAGFSLHLDIELALIKRNLALFGCVTYEEEKTKHMLTRIVRIKPTKIGLFMFSKALHENYV
jgi:hypothetical protein